MLSVIPDGNRDVGIGQLEGGDCLHVLEASGVQLDAVLLLDVGVSPVDTDEWQYAAEEVFWNHFLEKGLALERLHDGRAEAETELGAFAAGEVGEVEDEAQALHGECLETFLEQDITPYWIDITPKEDAAAVQADGVDIDDAIAAGEVLFETVAIAASDEYGPIWSLFFDAGLIDLLEETGLDEAFGQHKLRIQVFHLRALWFGLGLVRSKKIR